MRHDTQTTNAEEEKSIMSHYSLNVRFVNRIFGRLVLRALDFGVFGGDNGV